MNARLLNFGIRKGVLEERRKRGHGDGMRCNSGACQVGSVGIEGSCEREVVLSA